MTNPDFFDFAPAYTDDYPMVFRCIAFVDVCHFTSFTHLYGSRSAANMIELFRAIVRPTSGKCRVRVAKWLGDGVMIVGTDTTTVLKCIDQISKQCTDHNIEIHCGVAADQVLIFEGDDYLGWTVNLASRLCDVAKPQEALMYGAIDEQISERITKETCPPIEIAEFGVMEGIHLLKLDHIQEKQPVL